MKDAESVLATYAAPGGEFWVVVDAQHDTEVLAQVAVQRLPATDAGGVVGELRRMAVGPKAAHKGVGSKLVRTVEEFAAATGFTQVVLTTGSFMGAALALYTRCGFEFCRSGHPAPSLQEKLDAAGEELVEMAFRKPVSSNNGRWLWQPHGNS
jgi:GNAT superfamily N-acetyltransferase